MEKDKFVLSKRTERQQMNYITEYCESERSGPCFFSLVEADVDL